MTIKIIYRKILKNYAAIGLLPKQKQLFLKALKKRIQKNFEKQFQQKWSEKVLSKIITLKLLHF